MDKIQACLFSRNSWWRIIAENGKILAMSETYKTKHGCLKTAKRQAKFHNYRLEIVPPFGKRLRIG